AHLGQAGLPLAAQPVQDAGDQTPDASDEDCAPVADTRGAAPRVARGHRDAYGPPLPAQAPAHTGAERHDDRPHPEHELVLPSHGDRPTTPGAEVRVLWDRDRAVRRASYQEAGGHQERKGTVATLDGRAQQKDLGPLRELPQAVACGTIAIAGRDDKQSVG